MRGSDPSPETSHGRPVPGPPVGGADAPELAYLDGLDAASLVRGIQDSAACESAARGRLMRQVVALHKVAAKNAAARAVVEHGHAVSTVLAQDSPDLVLRDVAAEVGVALMLPAGSARVLVEQALILAGDLPHVLQALEAGAITWPKAKIILDEWRTLTDQAPRPGGDPPGAPGADALVADASEAVGEGDSADGSADGGPAREEALQIYREATKLTQELTVRAPHCTVRQLGDFSRRRRTRMGAAANQRACAAARKHRDVWITPEDNGLACLTAILDAPAATAIQSRINRMAQTLADTTRLTGEKRADVLTDLLLDGELPADRGVPRGIRGQVSVTVPATNLIGQDPELAPKFGSELTSQPRSRPQFQSRSRVQSQARPQPQSPSPTQVPAGTRSAAGPRTELSTPAGQGVEGGRMPRSASDLSTAPGPAPYAESGPHMVGYGPISDAQALEIAAGATSWRRLLTDPHTGVVTDHGRSTYVVPAGLRKVLEIRDQTCRFPGCRRQASSCDIDHTTAWESGGVTSLDNTAHLCRHHHSIKHQVGALGSWKVRHINPDHDDGTPPPTADPPEGPHVGGQQRPGVLEWTSPTGVVRRTVPGAPTPATTRWLVGTPNVHTPDGDPNVESAEGSGARAGANQQTGADDVNGQAHATDPNHVEDQGPQNDFSDVDDPPPF